MSNPTLRRRHRNDKNEHFGRGLEWTSGTGHCAARPMSQMGQTEKNSVRAYVSALPSNSDIARRIRHVSNVHNKRHRACYSRSRWSRPDVGTCPSSKRAANRCCRQQRIHLRYISCVASLCCQGIPPGYRIDTARQQITTLVETKKNAQLWLEDSVDTNQRNLVFQPCMISLSKTNGGVNIHNLINRGAT